MKQLAAIVCAASVGLLAIGAAAAPAPTPPATTSRECPTPELDTQRFVRAVTVDIRAPHGMLHLVPVTQTATRERGLMCVVRIPADRGMLFVFAPPDAVQGFWMKNTLVPLDMVFVTDAGIVSSVAANVPATPAGAPDDAVARRQGSGRFVLELGAGVAAERGIHPGTKLRLPALSAK